MATLNPHHTDDNVQKDDDLLTPEEIDELRKASIEAGRVHREMNRRERKGALKQSVSEANRD